MLLTKREEQLLKAFLKFGKLSMDNMSEMLGVSKRTVYRTLSDLTNSLATLGIAIIKENNKYYLLFATAAQGTIRTKVRVKTNRGYIHQ